MGAKLKKNRSDQSIEIKNLKTNFFPLGPTPTQENDKVVHIELLYLVGPMQSHEINDSSLIK